MRSFAAGKNNAIMKKKLVIFDLDGTLLDTLTDLAASTNHALQSLGYPQHPLEPYKHFVGNGIDKLFERALPAEARTPDNVARMREAFVPHYMEHSHDATAPYAGIASLLAGLAGAGVMTAVASNKFHAGALAVVDEYFHDAGFAAVIGLRDGHLPKPDAGIVHDIMSICRTPSAADVLYAGDTPVDIQTARNAGVPVAAVTWGFRSRAELEAEHPDYVVDTPDELLRLALGL